MIPVLTSAETREVDRASEAAGIPVETLMERAGWALARAALASAGGGYGRRAVVLAGKGDNGGDGLAAARFLRDAGVAVTTLLLAEREAYTGAAAANLGCLAGDRVLPVSAAHLARETARADVVVDALFGTGFRGTPEGPASEAIEAANAAAAPVIAADIPSGVHADTGAVPGPAVWATVTVTFGAPKAGALLFPGAERAGLVQVVDIGFPDGLLRSDLRLVEAGDVRWLLPVREPDAHKRRSGVVIVVAGSRGMPGAASLVAAGAAGLGAGLVRMAVVPSVRGPVASLHPEVTFLAVPEGEDGALGAGAFDALAGETSSGAAVAIGPGLTAGERTAAEVRRIVLEAPVPVVADADALNAFVGRAGELENRGGELVLTPHEGEFSRLFDVSLADLAADRVGAVRKAADAAGCTILLKGSRTLIAVPGGEVRINPTGTPFLATGGTGDVLTGAIATLLARGLSGFDAATAAAYVHGLAGRLSGAALGEAGGSPDVAARLGEAVRSVQEPT